jgi:hypothetical protein
MMMIVPALTLAIAPGLTVAPGEARFEAAAAAQSRPQSRPARDCFSARSVSGFSPAGREAVDVSVGANRHYRLTLGGYCPDVDWSLRLALQTRGGSSFICAGYDAEILVQGPTGLQRCSVTEVRRLTPEEVQARRRPRR